MIRIPSRPDRPKLESEIVSEIRAALLKDPDVRLSRNNVGKLRDGNGRLVTYGLGVGSPDLVGCVLMPPLVRAADGLHDEVLVARFLGLEVKRPEDRARVTDDQKRWLNAWIEVGAACAVVASVDEALAVVSRARLGDAFEHVR